VALKFALGKFCALLSLAGGSALGAWHTNSASAMHRVHDGAASVRG
jgi:hypothetical protein